MKNVIYFLWMVVIFAGCSQTVNNQIETDIDWQSFLADKDLLWDRAPFKWSQGAFVGNGLIGAMVYADSSGGLKWDMGRSDLFDHQGNDDDGNLNTRLPVGSFQLEGLSFDDFSMRQDLYNAEVTGQTLFSEDELAFQSFASYQHNVMVIDLEAKDSELPGLTWHPLPSYPMRKKLRDFVSPELTLADVTNPDPIQKTKGNIHLSIQPLNAGGEVVVAWVYKDLTKSKRSCYITITYSFPERTAEQEAVDILKKAVQADPQEMVKAHRDWWHAFYTESFVSIPDKQLETFYWIQMYKLASTTRSDRPAIDNSGIWYNNGPWSTYHWNMEIQMNYWPVYTANRLHLGKSLCKLFDSNMDNLIENVPQKYRYNSATIARTTSANLKGSIYRMTHNPGDAPEYANLLWACHNYWLQYRYSMDDGLLRDGLYPLLKRAVNFYLHVLIRDENGEYHTPLATSPEAGSAKDCNYDLAALRWACQTLIKSAERLNIDDPLLPQWRDVLQNLTDFPQDKDGYMMGKGVKAPQGHRHWSHLFMIYPYHVVNRNQPENQENIRKSLDYWDVNLAPVAFGYSGAASMYAALGDGDKAYFKLREILNEYPNARVQDHYSRICENTFNLFEVNEYSVLEGTLGIANAMQEMLLQSWGDVIRIFPAVPRDWQDVAFHDFRAEGAFLVSAVKKDGVTQFVRIKSLAGEPCKIITDLKEPVSVLGQSENILSQTGIGQYQFDLAKGEEVVLYHGEIPDLTITPVDTDDTYPHYYGLNKEQELK